MVELINVNRTDASKPKSVQQLTKRSTGALGFSSSLAFGGGGGGASGIGTLATTTKRKTLYHTTLA